MTLPLPTVRLQPITLKDLEFLPIGTPFTHVGLGVLEFLYEVRWSGKRRRTPAGEHYEERFEGVEFFTGFGLDPLKVKLGISHVTDWHLKERNYRVVLRPTLDELVPFHNEGFDYAEFLMHGITDPNNPTNVQQGHRDNPYDKATPMSKVWHEGYLRAQRGRPNPCRKG